MPDSIHCYTFCAFHAHVDVIAFKACVHLLLINLLIDLVAFSALKLSIFV